MNRKHVIASLAVLLLSPAWLAAQEEATAAAEPVPAHIDARADKRVQEMSAFLAGQRQFKFTVAITYDAVEADGQKIQLARTSRVQVARPNKLHVESRGDRGWDQVSVFDGAHFLLHDRSRGVFGRVETPNTFDAFFGFLADNYGAAPPVADFLLKDSHAALTSGAISGGILGEARVDETVCDHLAFSGDLLDWQLWIEQGERPWPRKFVVTYKDIDVRPQFMAVFRGWETEVSGGGDVFSTNAPNGAREVPMERFTEESAGADEQTEANRDED